MSSTSSSSSTTPPPIYIWTVNISRRPTPEEYQMCLRILDPESQKKVLGLAKHGKHGQAWSCMVGRLTPHIIMQQRNIPREQWYVETSPSGKPHIVTLNTSKHLGYNTTRNHHFAAVAFALGDLASVENVGCDCQRLKLPPKTHAELYIESVSHKLTQLELNSLLNAPEKDEETLIRRLFTIWTIKEAYLKAIAQPLRLGFAWDRIEFDAKNQTIRVDGVPLGGWEFRIFTAYVHVQARDLKPARDESYQVTVAIHRGGTDLKICWDSNERLKTWVRSVPIESFLEAARTLPLPPRGSR